MTRRYHTSLRHRGFSLIEVLIALVILSVGLLGIAAMVSVSLKSKDSAFYRTEALAQATAILNRMRANRATALTGGYNINFGASAPSSPNCNGSANACVPANIANMDLTQWKSDLVTLLGSGADGKVAIVSVAQFTQITITIKWTDTRASAALNETQNASAKYNYNEVTITSGI